LRLSALNNATNRVASYIQSHAGHADERKLFLQPPKKNNRRPQSGRPAARAGGGQGASKPFSGKAPARDGKTADPAKPRGKSDFDVKAGPRSASKAGPNAGPKGARTNGPGRAAGEAAPSRTPRPKTEGAGSRARFNAEGRGKAEVREKAAGRDDMRGRDQADRRTGTDARARTRPETGPETGDRARLGGNRRPAGDGKSSPRPPRSFPPRKHSTKAPAHSSNPHPAHAAAAEGKEPQRIAKLLARAGIASRREIERMITEGRVALDGELLTTPATLLSSLHGVTVDGVAVGAPAPARLFLFHKPVGYLTTERDPQGRPTIYDRLPDDLPRVMPVGRLDMSTEGLLLLTTDGELKRQLELPATGVTRSYRARAFGEVSQADLEELVMGIEIEGVRYGRIHANLERRTGRNQWIEMSLTEGKNREVRRVLEHLGLKVNRLIRTSYGPFALEDLPVGAIFEVRQHDLIVFRNTLKKGKYDGDSDAS
jgi:23S rRNA pseudouridine2605 synthase